MKISTLVFFCCCAFLLSGCSDFDLRECFCNEEDEGEENQPLTIEELNDIADQHEQVLKQYFTYGSDGDVNEYGGGSDVSTLLSKTMAISVQFKERGMYARANQFDSYVDVLMYGNQTIDESIRDVEDLVKGRGSDMFASDTYDGPYNTPSKKYGNRKKNCCRRN